MNQLSGTQIFNDGKYTVHQCTDGFTVSNGQEVKFSAVMPTLDANLLAVYFNPSITNFQNWQLSKYGNIVKESTNPLSDTEEDSTATAFDRQLSMESAAADMYAYGY